MARKSNETQADGIVVTDADTPALPAMADAANVLAAAQAAYGEEAPEVSRLPVPPGCAPAKPRQLSAP